MPRLKGLNNLSVSSTNSAEGGARTGTIIAWSNGVVPYGWMECDGSALLRADYPALFQTIGTTWGDGTQAMPNGTAISSGFLSGTAFNLPDGRGNFLRGVSGSAGRDPNAAARTAPLAGGQVGNVVGSYQADALQNITGSVSNLRRNNNSAAVASGAFTVSQSNAASSGSGGESRPVATITLNAANVARTSTETRPKNINVKYIIKL